MEDVALYCAGRPLEGEENLSTSLVDQATIDVEVRILGGEPLTLDDWESAYITSYHV